MWDVTRKNSFRVIIFSVWKNQRGSCFVLPIELCKLNTTFFQNWTNRRKMSVKPAVIQICSLQCCDIDGIIRKKTLFTLLNTLIRCVIRFTFFLLLLRCLSSLVIMWEVGGKQLSSSLAATKLYPPPPTNFPFLQCPTSVSGCCRLTMPNQPGSEL